MVMAFFGTGSWSALDGFKTSSSNYVMQKDVGGLKSYLSLSSSSFIYLSIEPIEAMSSSSSPESLFIKSIAFMSFFDK
jgi:hypothetical protein